MKGKRKTPHDAVDIFISSEQKLSCDQNLNDLNYAHSLKNMQKSKTPGSNGLSQELVWHFWSEIAPMYVELMDEIYDAEILTESQRK